MNLISSLAKQIQARFPRWRFTEDVAEQPGGSSFLDVEFEGRTAVVEWRPGKGFGISAGPIEGYGTGPDEVYPTAESVLERLEDVLERAQRTVPIRKLSLKRLRSWPAFPSRWRLYRNGEEVASTVAARGLFPVNAPWALGARGGGMERFFQRRSAVPGG